MHMPFCTVAAKCLRCDHVRATREVNRLRGVLRVTMDDLIAEREEVKELNIKVQRLITALSTSEGDLFELASKVRMVQVGKMSACDVFVPGPSLPSDSEGTRKQPASEPKRPPGPPDPPGGRYSPQWGDDTEQPKRAARKPDEWWKF